MNNQISAVGTATPATPPGSANVPVVALRCDMNGCLYTNIVIGPSGVPIDGVGNLGPKAASGAQVNLPAVTFGYTFDPTSGDWLPTSYRSTDAPSIVVDTFTNSAFRVQSLPYVYSTTDGEYIREVSAQNRPSFTPNINQQVKQVVCFPYMFGVTSSNDPINVALKPFTFDSMNELGNALVVREQNDVTVHDAPAAATQAQTPAAQGSNGQPVIVTGIGVTLTAVAAQAAPVLVQLIEDTAGAANVLWSTQLLCPAGQSKELWIECNFAAQVDVQLTVAAPAATNFVTATLQFNASAGNGSF